ncbi:unnamed protein product [Eruca vesicaria subsp. sativa]|uniref:Uncharacterized protein n=1 Tax=Eruca vesicaria subsp. sativa TaxID=29727 RepID=A0ABC8KHX8_ERUVS|nr:unnamed protein product [Eruca vesicaria subsp. sativa]
MNVKTLTRHNVASHLQKYRSHRKHVLAREAEAASWNLRRHATVAVTGVGGKKPWMAPGLGYLPHVTTMHHGHFRPLHVWGHPTWPKHKPNNPSSTLRSSDVSSSGRCSSSVIFARSYTILAPTTTLSTGKFMYKVYRLVARLKCKIKIIIKKGLLTKKKLKRVYVCKGYGMATPNHSMYNNNNKPETSIGVPTRQLSPTNPPPIDIHPVSAPLFPLNFL